MTELDEARKLFADDCYATCSTGCVIDAVGEKYAKCSLALDGRHCNAVGQIMGGVTYTLADFVFAVASNFRQSKTVTLTAQISYLNPVKGTTLIGESRLIKDGRRNCFYEIHITDDLGTPIAVASITGAHVGEPV